MFKSFWGSQEQQEIPGPSSSSWYSPSDSSRPSTPGSTTTNAPRPSDFSQSQSSYGQVVSPSEAVAIIHLLKDRSVDELRKLLSDKDSYNQFLLSLDQVKIQNNLRDELRKGTLQLARENQEKEPRILELRNQCRIIRTTELAAAQEKLNELQRQKEENLKFYSPSTRLQKLQDSMNKIEEESRLFTSSFLRRRLT
ncbi:hypothetical protein IFM89_034342 [Coptis chinensis]|uniref:VPS37 C-terminal domain-containing protein n=1 Tax=Coptis chinensis TaxID=261450 RepID=A0A835H8B7_9MAGN|nr:hypothetical protein IFM89_034342 [Coptis chinensis]